MLKFEGKDWQPYGTPELRFDLRHPAVLGKRISWNIELGFAPAGVDLDGWPAPLFRHLYVDVYGYLPRAMDWRDLEGMLCEPPQESFVFGPEIHVNSHGPGDCQSRGPDTTACLVRFRRRDEWKFEVELSAWFTREASMLWQLRQLRQQLVPAGGGEDDEAELPEEWTQSRDLYWIGDVNFTQVSCVVPANSPRPHDLAKRMAVAKLKLTEFHSIRINGECENTPARPDMGVSQAGRLMILTTPYS